MRRKIQKWWPLTPLLITIAACGGSGTEISQTITVIDLVEIREAPVLLRPNETYRAKVVSKALPGEMAADTFGFVAEVDPPGAATVTFDKQSAVPDEEVGMTIAGVYSETDRLKVDIVIKRTNPKNLPTKDDQGSSVTIYSVSDTVIVPKVDGSIRVEAQQSPMSLVKGQATRVKFNVSSANGVEMNIQQGVELVSGSSYGFGVIGDNPCTVPATGTIERELGISPSEACTGGKAMYIVYDAVTGKGRGAAILEFTTVDAIPGNIMLELQPTSLAVKPHYGAETMAKVTSLNGFAGDVTVEVVQYDTRVLSLMEPTKPKTVKLTPNSSALVKVRLYRVGKDIGPPTVLVRATTATGESIDQPVTIQYD